MSEVVVPSFMRKKVTALQAEVLAMPQYEPETKHYFHGGMYCREVYRDAGVLVIGKVHKREHFYVIASGVVLITDGDSEPTQVTGPAVIKSMPGNKRAVLSITPTTCMTFHATETTTVEAAEAEMVEDEPLSTYGLGNVLKAKELK